MKQRKSDFIQKEVQQVIQDLAGAYITELDSNGRPDMVVGVGGLTITGIFCPAEAAAKLKSVRGAVIHDGANLLFEVKSPGGRFTPQQVEWWAERWPGPRHIVQGDELAIKELVRKIILGK